MLGYIYMYCTHGVVGVGEVNKQTKLMNDEEANW
jgi:hypothetical protein